MMEYDGTDDYYSNPLYNDKQQPLPQRPLSICFWWRRDKNGNVKIISKSLKIKEIKIEKINE